MNIETLKCMIVNSTWIDAENKTVYEFFNENDLAINGINHIHYSLNSVKNRVEIKMGQKKKYYIEYVDDFTLKLNDGEEWFTIIPK